MDSDFNANAAVAHDDVAASVTIGDGIPFDCVIGADAEGRVYVEFVVPKTTGGSRPVPTDGMPLTIVLTPAARTPTGEKVVTFTVRP